MVQLQDANAHEWAHVAAWLADPSDARDVRAFRSTCSLGVRAFDVAVHAGWVALAAHESVVADEEGATCRWVNGWLPVDVRAASSDLASLKSASSKAPAKKQSKHKPKQPSQPAVVRVEHRLVPRADSLGGPNKAWFVASGQRRWAGPSVIVCETLQPSSGLDARLSFETFAAGEFSFRLAASTVAGGRVADGLCMSRHTLRRFDTAGLAGITSIGASFLANCAALTAVDTRGLCSVTRIGDGFMSSCASLAAFDAPAADFASLTSIGHTFLDSCAALTCVDTSGLRAVKTIGTAFLGSNEALTTLNLAGLASVTTVGELFLTGAKSLPGTLATRGCLESLTTIDGRYFLNGLARMTAFDSSGLSAVTSVGDGFLNGARSLTALETEGLSATTAVGNHFAGKNPKITSVDLSGLTSVTTIGSDFLGGCDSLTSLNTNGLESVTDIGKRFVQGASGLTSLDAGGLTSVTTLGAWFASHCTRLTDIDTTGLATVTSSGRHFAYCCHALKRINTPLPPAIVAVLPAWVTYA
jgi:hypothetical protein